jgi:hypothetical protein
VVSVSESRGCGRPAGGSPRGAAGALLAVLALGLAAGCATRPSLPLPPQPVTAEPRDGVAPLTRSYSEVVVRAYFADGDARREVGGADCVLATDGHAASFASPGRVIVPVRSDLAPPLRVSCRAEGREGTAQQPLLRRWADYPPYGYPGPWDPWGYRWGYDRIGYPRSGAWLTLSYPGPYGPWGPYAVYYPDIAVRMR